jgi:hypothetical protein
MRVVTRVENATAGSAVSTSTSTAAPFVRAQAAQAPLLVLDQPLDLDLVLAWGMVPALTLALVISALVPGASPKIEAVTTKPAKALE